MIPAVMASIAGRRRAAAPPPPPPPPPPERFDITTLFSDGDDGIFIAPSNLASLRKRVNGEEPASNPDDPVGVAINLENRLALSSDYISDPALATSAGWTGQTGSSGNWQHSAGSWGIANAVNTFRLLRHDNRGLLLGALYEFEIDAVRSAGSFSVRLGVSSVITNAANFNQTGNYKWTLVSGASEDTIRVVAVNAGTTVSFSRISVKRYLGRYGRATSDATRPILKQDGDAWYFSRPGSESLKLWGGSLSGCTICYATDTGVTLLEDQSVGVDYELLKGPRTYGIVVINRALTTQEKTDLQAEMALLITGGASIPDEPDPISEWVSLGSTSKTTFRNFVEGPTQYDLRATGANAVVYTWPTANVAAETITWADHGLTTPVAVEIEGAALSDPQITHFALGGNDLDGTFPPVAGMTGLSQLYVARNQKPAPIPSIGALSNLATFWAHDNGATGWSGSSVPHTLKDLKLYGNAFNQATVDAILSQCNAASLGVGSAIDLGGTNATPSNAGWNSRDALIARGAAVVVSGEDPRVDTPVGFKWQPGHYILIGNSDAMTNILTDVASRSIVKGIQNRYFWDVLEPTKNNYDLTTIRTDVARLAEIGKYLIIQLQYKSFSSTRKMIPPYLQTSEYDGGSYQTAHGNWNLRLWNANVVTRLRALIAAIAAEFDGSPTVVSINTIEPDPEWPSTDSPLYSTFGTLKNQYTQATVALGPYMRGVFPHTSVVLYNNHNATAQPLFRESSLAHGVGHGAPDTYPCSYAAQSGAYHGYTTAELLKGKVPICYAVQWNNYASCGVKLPHQNPESPQQELFTFNRNVLGTNYLCWEKRPLYWPGTLAFLDSIPTTYPGDPSGGLASAFPTLLKQ